MSRWIDADIYVTVNLYDDEHEEYRDERMTIADCLDRFTDEGCPTEGKPKQQWIPVSERLPEECGDYLVTKKTIGWNCEEYQTNDIAYYDSDGFHKADTVVAWMPLPEPYKEV